MQNHILWNYPKSFVLSVQDASMARFGNVAELATFMGKLDADYAEYAPAL